MTGAEAVALIQARMGQRTNLAIQATLELNVAQQMKLEKANFYPWFLEAETQSLVTVVNQEWVALPTDFLGLDEELGGLFVNDGTGTVDPWIPVRKDLYVNFKERYRDPLSSAASTATAPEVYDIVGSRLYMRPIPNSVKTLRLIYMQKQAAIANDGTTNLWLTHAHDWLVGEAGIMMAAFQTQNPELGGLFSTMATAGASRCRAETTMRRENGREASMGED